MPLFPKWYSIIGQTKLHNVSWMQEAKDMQPSSHILIVGHLTNLLPLRVTPDPLLPGKSLQIQPCICLLRNFQCWASLFALHVINEICGSGPGKFQIKYGKFSKTLVLLENIEIYILFFIKQTSHRRIWEGPRPSEVALPTCLELNCPVW